VANGRLSLTRFRSRKDTLGFDTYFPTKEVHQMKIGIRLNLSDLGGVSRKMTVGVGKILHKMIRKPDFLAH
jgi:hypothetical protein